ncbi:unnamed protein product [Schistosoma curassoni]|uniref:Peptidase A2 domain-containing protein n=1 Tax=Schistosoma curassoni TaxID=6186 RepID=A0A183KE70_9TREM|nr:unnamed protein product [Schistosoma curassoni]
MQKIRVDQPPPYLPERFKHLDTDQEIDPRFQFKFNNNNVKKFRVKFTGINIPSLERELLRMPNCSFQDAGTACNNYEAVNELDIQSMKISNTLLSRRGELQSQGQSKLRSFNSDSYLRVNMEGVSTRNYKGNHEVMLIFKKRLYTSLGSFHDFILDTGSIESIVSFKNLKSSDPNVVVRPTEVSILGITGHRLPIRGCCELLIRNDNSSYIPCEFSVSETGLSVLG